MNILKLLSIACLLLYISSCTTEEELPLPNSKSLSHSQLIGHWNITVPTGLMFLEFMEGNQVLIDDRGAIGPERVSTRHLERYEIDQNVIRISNDCFMSNITFSGDNMYFTFLNKNSGRSTPFQGKKIIMDDMAEPTRLLTQPWKTIEENGQPISQEYQKIVHFSEAGIYLIKDIYQDNIELFSWEWAEDTDHKVLCYTHYQRPMFIPEELCIKVRSLTEEEAWFDIAGNIIRMEPFED